MTNSFAQGMERQDVMMSNRMGLGREKIWAGTSEPSMTLPRCMVVA